MAPTSNSSKHLPNCIYVSLSQLQFIFLQQLAGDHQALDLAGSLADEHKGRVTVIALDIELFGVAKAAMNAHRFESDFLAHLGGKEFGHASFQVAALAPVLFLRGLLEQETRRLYPGRHIGQLELDGLVLGNRLAKGGALLRVLDGVVKCRLGHTYSSRRYVDTPDLQSAHNVFKPLAFAATKQAVRSHTHIIEDKFGGLTTLIAKLFKGTAHAQSRCALFNNEDTHAAIGWANVCTGARQHGKDTAVHAICDPEFGAVEQAIIAFAYSGPTNALPIAACIRLRNSYSPPFIPSSPHKQKTPALLLRP